MVDFVTPNGSSMPDPQRVEAAELYAVGTPIGEIAAKFHTTVRTIRRWIAEPAGRQAIQEIRSASVSSHTGRTIALTERAIGEFELLMEDEDPKMRLGAASKLVDTMLKLHALSEFENRLAQIESQLGINGKNKREWVS